MQDQVDTFFQFLSKKIPCSRYCFYVLILESLRSCHGGDPDIKFMRSKFNTGIFRKLRDCIIKSKWSVCHFLFRACNYDTESNSWKYYPICRESCYSYANIESCKHIVEFILQWHHEAKKHACYDNKLHRFNCSLYPA